MRVPDYLCRILQSYFENRVFVYATDAGRKELKVTAGVPQGSILGPKLWNGMYDGVESLVLPKGVDIVGFADDVVLKEIRNAEGSGSATTCYWSAFAKQFNTLRLPSADMS